ncbi:putative PepSY-like beta-lactamase-inhibitor [Mariniflexile fucanivorans]|uniref:Putative PepSY-like beta-lactamase-inhibitor n=1 Tax=Mariniflexile fucanivorans TaxID=264023 RepID=A0A4V2QDY6_9FLAO|nr:PepSY-like domain-containing protein [Mariniflexile fucanivorans]TCL66047.1 putative PepSY-like beta-lactamase-inhibitor [Mariniflexile fucanivorans]
MKTVTKLLVLFIGCSLLAFTSSIKKDPPQKVKEAFAKKFPNIKKADWDKESETEWEAEFKMNKVEYSANFLSDGTWLETEHDIKMKDVPKNILNTLKSEFSGYAIEEAEISETSKGVFYEFEIEKDKIEMEVVFDTNGKILKKELKEDEEND